MPPVIDIGVGPGLAGPTLIHYATMRAERRGDAWLVEVQRNIIAQRVLGLPRA